MKKEERESLWREIQDWKGCLFQDRSIDISPELIKLKEVFKKADTYDNYLKAVDEGKIAVLNNEEAKKVCTFSKRVKPFLEKVTNWKGE